MSGYVRQVYYRLLHHLWRRHNTDMMVCDCCMREFRTRWRDSWSVSAGQRQ